MYSKISGQDQEVPSFQTLKYENPLKVITILRAGLQIYLSMLKVTVTTKMTPLSFLTIVTMTTKSKKSKAIAHMQNAYWKVYQRQTHRKTLISVMPRLPLKFSTSFKKESILESFQFEKFFSADFNSLLNTEFQYLCQKLKSTHLNHHQTYSKEGIIYFEICTLTVLMDRYGGVRK